MIKLRQFLTFVLVLFLSEGCTPNQDNTIPQKQPVAQDYINGTIVRIDSTRPSGAGSDKYWIFHFKSVIPNVSDTVSTALLSLDTTIYHLVPSLVGANIRMGIHKRATTFTHGTFNKLSQSWWIDNATFFPEQNTYREPNLPLPCAKGTIYSLDPYSQSFGDSIWYYYPNIELVCGDTIQDLAIIDTVQTSPNSLIGTSLEYYLDFSSGTPLLQTKTTP